MDGCSPGLELAPIEACPLTLSWSPTRLGTLLDDVQVAHTGARGILVLPIRGQSEGVVSQDQKAIVLSGAADEEEDREITHVVGTEGAVVSSQKLPSRARGGGQKSGGNVVSALDGFKITSFAKTRAIVNGPGGAA